MPAGDSETTPRMPHFDTVLRGYNQRQVNERVTRLAYDLRHAAKGRDEAVAKVAELTRSLGSVQQQLLQTNARLNRISSAPASTEAMTERQRLMWQLAEEEIGEFKREADEYNHSTRVEADEYNHSTKTTANAHASQVRTEADRYATAARAAADTYATKTQAAAERESADTRAAEQAELERELATQKAAAEQQAATLIEDAKTHAATIVEDAEQTFAEAAERAQQASGIERRVAEQVAATFAILEDARQYFTTGQDQRTIEPPRKLLNT